MGNSQKPIKLHFILEFLRDKKNKSSLKSDVVKDNHQPINLHLVSELL